MFDKIYKSLSTTGKGTPPLEVSSLLRRINPRQRWVLSTFQTLMATVPKASRYT